MNPNSLSRAARAAIAVLAIAAIGVVVAPAPAAHAAATAWTCTGDTFVWRTDTLNQAVATSGVPLPTAGPALVASPATLPISGLNAIARHPVTGIVYAFNVGSVTSTAARTISPDGTVEDASATVPLTNVTRTGYAGGTFTSDGYWLLADASGNFATVDLTDPSSPTYGTVVYQGLVRDTAGGVTSRWLSGDMSYRASDDRVYFTTWTAATPMGASVRVGSIPRIAFFDIIDIVPTFGPTVMIPGASNNSGAASGFDSAGNLWMSTNLLPANPRQQVIWRLDAAALTGTDPITPANPAYLPAGSGTDGFMCIAPAPAPIALAAAPAAATATATANQTLAETGSAADALPVAGGGAALLIGAVLIIFAGRRRRFV